MGSLQFSLEPGLERADILPSMSPTGFLFFTILLPETGPEAQRHHSTVPA